MTITIAGKTAVNDVTRLVPAEEVLWEEDPEDVSTSIKNIPEVQCTLVESLGYGNDLAVNSLATPTEVKDNAFPSVEAFPLSMRAEFLYASAFLPSNGEAGIRFEERTNFGVAIKDFDDFSPLRGSGIRPGDHVIAINCISCAEIKDLSFIQKLISSSKSTISICVHNKHGNPHLVSSSVQKPTASSKVGITMKTKRGTVYINQVYKDGLFAQSLLMPGHRLFAINGNSCIMDAEAVAQIIASSNERVTIVSKPQMYCRQEESYAVTLALCEHKTWWKNVLFGAGVAAGAVATIGSFA
jgi:predicted metalloprotease with PDZ domain